MSSRRSLKTAEQRLSRQTQFWPGHMTGRVDSAQPIRRLGGTVRRPWGTAAPAPPSPPAACTAYPGPYGELYDWTTGFPGLYLDWDAWVPAGEGHWFMQIAESPSTVFITRSSGDFGGANAAATFAGGWWSMPDDCPLGPPWVALYASSVLDRSPSNQIGSCFTPTAVVWCIGGESP